MKKHKAAINVNRPSERRYTTDNNLLVEVEVRYTRCGLDLPKEHVSNRWPPAYNDDSCKNCLRTKA